MEVHRELHERRRFVPGQGLGQPRPALIGVAPAAVHAQGVEDNQTVRAEFATIVQNFPDEANLTGRRQLAVRIVRQGGRGGAGASCRPG